MLMSLSKLKSAFFGETVVRTHEYDIQRFIARADPQGLRKYLQKNPQAIQNSIGPFQKAKFENFHSKPENIRNAFLQCGLEIIENLHHTCPEIVKTTEFFQTNGLEIFVGLRTPKSLSRPLLR